MKPAAIENDGRREWLGVAIVSAIGLGLRLWPVGRLGLTHFDEGIYAMVASWSLQPKGLAAIDPMLIPYAPPGYPILGGLAYGLLGRSDGAMIAVSQLAGTLTIPVVAWLARRTFGAGSGFAAACFCAFSGPHIAFSRMAMTDVSFLLAWLVAIGSGMRFLERPGPWRAVTMGMAVGLAQEFKYNGWLTGGIVIGSALFGIAARSEERKARSILKTFGWGGLAAGVAWIVVWPWYAFVEAHGGYPALLRHQQSYLGGVADWWPNLISQADQAQALSGGGWIVWPSLFVVGIGLALIGPPAWRPVLPCWATLGRSVGVPFCVCASFFFLNSPHKLGLLMLPWLLFRGKPFTHMVGVWWLVLVVMTPFYHPYARLWLPFHAANWLLLGWLNVFGIGSGLTSRPSNRLPILSGRFARFVNSEFVGNLLACGVILFALLGRRPPGESTLLESSDSLYRATVQVVSILPEEVQGLRLLVRPPITYYLAGRTALYPMAGSDQLLKGSDRRTWALVDSAILRSEAGASEATSGRKILDRFADQWEVVEEFPTTLSLPTLFDLDPRASQGDHADRSCPLWLLRPRTPKATR